jgi:predicted metalloprotease
MSGLGGGRGLRIGGIGGVGAIVVLVVAMLFGVDPGMLLQGGSDRPGYAPETQVASGTPDDEMGRFVAAVLADTEDSWHAIFQQHGGTYQEPKLVLFTGGANSGCGFADTAVGPFYCPSDGKVYLDLDFFRELARRFGAPGDFAQAYVIAHEIGHHVQELLGIMDQADAARQRLGKADANALSVKIELQADCFAGIWAHDADRTRQILESGDVEEALTAASAIGDDRLQMQGQGYVVPESFTHGSAEQRVRWFEQGFASGRLEDCNTFGTTPL